MTTATLWSPGDIRAFAAEVNRVHPTGEGRLLEPLVAWLYRARRINAKSRVAVELPWLGRRVDLATVTSTGRTAAYELKLGGLSRALEQAAYNRLSFDRSYVVTAGWPRASNLEVAAEEGIGVIVVSENEVVMLLESPARRAIPTLRRGVVEKLVSAEGRRRV